MWHWRPGDLAYYVVHGPSQVIRSMNSQQVHRIKGRRLEYPVRIISCDWQLMIAKAEHIDADTGAFDIALHLLECDPEAFMRDVSARRKTT